MMKALIPTLLLISALAAAIEKPAIEWAYAYSQNTHYFFDVIETEDGNFLVAGQGNSNLQQTVHLLWLLPLSTQRVRFFG